jgi:serine/threonine protein kinase
MCPKGKKKKWRSVHHLYATIPPGSNIRTLCYVQQVNGEYLTDEVRGELETLRKIEHPNLMRFLGFFERRDDCLVVLEYVGNGSLREHLDGTGSASEYH